MNNAYKVNHAYGSGAFQYRVTQSSDTYASKESATKNELYLEASTSDRIKKLIISNDEAGKVKWLKPYLDNAEEAISFYHDDIFECVTISKIDLL